MIDLYLFRTALRDLLRPKRLLVAVGLMLMPAALALLLRYCWREGFDPQVIYNLIVVELVFGFLLIMLAVVFGTGVIAQELEQKTIVYLLTRPVARWRIALMKFLAAMAVIVTTVWISDGLLALSTFGLSEDAGSPKLRTGHIKDPETLWTRLRDGSDPVSTYLQEHFGKHLRTMLKEYAFDAAPSREFQATIREINDVLRTDAHFYDPERFADVTLRPETKRLLAAKPAGGDALFRLNRLLLEDAYPDEIEHLSTPKLTLRRDLLILPVGAFAYGALFLLLATILNRPLLYGLVFAFGWESWVPLLPGNFSRASLMTYLRVLAPHPKPEAESMDITEFMSSLSSRLTPDVISMRAAWWVLIGVTLVALVAALFIFSYNEYVPREDT